MNKKLLNTLELKKRSFIYIRPSSIVNRDLFYCLIADATGEIFYSDQDITLENIVRSLPLAPAVVITWDPDPKLANLIQQSRGSSLNIRDLMRFFPYSQATIDQMDSPEDAYTQIMYEYADLFMDKKGFIPYRKTLNSFRIGGPKNFIYSEMAHQIDIMIALHNMLTSLLHKELSSRVRRGL